MRQRQVVSLGVLPAVVAVAVLASPATAQDGPRTAWGAPDLQGVWDFRTITPLQRPQRYEDREFLTREEAAALKRDAINRDQRRLLALPRLVWLDRVPRTIEARRTSLIVDPPNGRMPARTEAAQARMAARRGYRAEQAADSWLDRRPAERCILGLNSGPPITPRGYNQNIHVF